VSTFGVPEIFSYKEKAKKEKEAKKKKSKGKGEDDDLEAVTFECNNLSVTGDIKITLIERSATLVGRMEEVRRGIRENREREPNLTLSLSLSLACVLVVVAHVLVLVQHSIHRQLLP